MPRWRPEKLKSGESAKIKNFPAADTGGKSRKPNKHTMKTAIRKALDHVHLHFPQITMVVFSPKGKWQFCDDDFNALSFNGPEGAEIDISILEDAADAAEWPSVHAF